MLMKAIRNRPFFVPLILFAACGGGTGAAKKSTTEPAVEEGQEVEPVSETADDLRPLLLDLANAKLCKQVEGTIMALSGSGGSTDGGREPSAGLLWVQDCSVSAVDPTHVRLQISGKGWRWVERSPEKAGAEFEVDHYARFSVDTNLVATADLAYAPKEKIVTAWLLPAQPVQADLNSIGNIPVEEEQLWAEIVGGAAALVGQSPSERAEQRVAKRGSRRFESKMAKGFSLAVNLCTGRRALRLGKWPQGKMPDLPMAPEGQLQQGGGRAILHDEGLMLYGPYRGGKQDQLKATVALRSGGGARAELVCEQDARRYYQAFLDDESSPSVDALESKTVERGQTSSIETSGMDCPVVLALRPVEDGSVPVELEWTVFRPGRGFEPIISCEK